MSNAEAQISPGVFDSQKLPLFEEDMYIEAEQIQRHRISLHMMNGRVVDTLLKEVAPKLGGQGAGYTLSDVGEIVKTGMCGSIADLISLLYITSRAAERRTTTPEDTKRAQDNYVQSIGRVVVRHAKLWVAGSVYVDEDLHKRRVGIAKLAGFARIEGETAGNLFELRPVVKVGEDTPVLYTRSDPRLFMAIVNNITRPAYYPGSVIRPELFGEYSSGGEVDLRPPIA